MDLDSQVCKDLMVDLVYVFMYVCARVCECAYVHTHKASITPHIAWVEGSEVASSKLPDNLAAIRVRWAFFIPALVLGVLALYEQAALSHQWNL